MYPIGPIDVIALAALWTWALWNRNTRYWTTVGLLLTVTAAHIALSLVPGTASLVARVTVWTIAVGAFMFKPEWFMVRTDADVAFDRSYWLVQQDMTAMARRRLAGETDDQAFASEIRQLLRRLEEMHPPDEDWQAVRNDTVGVLRRQLPDRQSADQGDVPPPSIDTVWAHYAKIRHDRTRFWGRRG